MIFFPGKSSAPRPWPQPTEIKERPAAGRTEKGVIGEKRQGFNRFLVSCPIFNQDSTKICPGTQKVARGCPVPTGRYHCCRSICRKPMNGRPGSGGCWAAPRCAGSSGCRQVADHGNAGGRGIGELHPVGLLESGRAGIAPPFAVIPPFIGPARGEIFIGNLYRFLMRKRNSGEYNCFILSYLPRCKCIAR